MPRGPHGSILVYLLPVIQTRDVSRLVGGTGSTRHQVNGSLVALREEAPGPGPGLYINPLDETQPSRFSLLPHPMNAQNHELYWCDGCRRKFPLKRFKACGACR